jgi:hypothetical protein
MYQQMIVSILLLTSMAGTFGLVHVGSNSRWLSGIVNSWDIRRFRDNREHLMNRGMFLEFEDRLILDEIPHADYSRGGVYFFGSSPMKWGLATWNLPPDLRRVIGNYGIGASSHELQYAFIRHLVEHEGFLKAGGDKVHVVLGLYWSMGQDWKASSYFKPLWERHGLYTYSDADGIQPVAANSVLVALRIERARCTGFIGSNVNRLARALVGAMGIPLSETEQIQDPERVRQWALTLTGTGDWRQGLDHQMIALEQLVGYLQQRNVGVTVALLPERAAFAELPEPMAYHKAVRDLCLQRAIPAIDLTHFLAEDEFWDINHSNYNGLMKTHAALMSVAVDRLRGMGVYEYH